jgi:hypothetical protein
MCSVFAPVFIKFFLETLGLNAKLSRILNGGIINLGSFNLDLKFKNIK